MERKLSGMSRLDVSAVRKHDSGSKRCCTERRKDGSIGRLEIVTRGAAVGFGENCIGWVGREERKIIINFLF
jgi:hypothetical protein